LDLEEDWEKESVIFFMKKYKRLLKYLFDKYINTGYSKKAVEYYSVGKQKEYLYLGELIKMYRDHNVTSLMNNEFSMILRLINTKHNRNDLTSINFDGFCEYFIQSAIYIYSKPPIILSHLPLVESLKELLKQFELAADKRGENLLKYQEPEMVGIEDKELVYKLNKKLQIDASFVLPEGFKKVQERLSSLEYCIRPSLDKHMNESTRIAVEILDEIISKNIFGAHILEPTVKYRIKLKAYPIPLNISTPVAKLNNTNNSVKLQPLENSPKKLPVNMRLEVASFPKELRSLAKEVAEVVDEVVVAVENNQSTLSRKKGKLNKFLKEKQELIEEKNRLEAERQQKWKAHHQMLKQRVTELKKKEEIETEIKRKEEEELKKKERERLQKQKEEFQRERERAKKKIQEARELKEKQKAQEEADTQLKKDAEKHNKQREEVLRKRKEEIVIIGLIY